VEFRDARLQIKIEEHRGHEVEGKGTPALR